MSTPAKAGNIDDRILAPIEHLAELVTANSPGKAGKAAQATAEPDDSGEWVPWAEAPLVDRQDALRALFIPRDVEERVVTAIREALHDRYLHPEAQNVAIIGETGVGKSEIMKRILAAHPERRDPETRCVVRPVLYVDTRNSSTPKAAATALIEALATFEGKLDLELKKLLVGPSTASIAALTGCAKAQMVGQGVRLVILDEFHNTIVDNGVVRLNRIANWVRDFAKSKSRSAAMPDASIDETIVFALVGTRRVKEIIDPTVNAELASIAPYRVEVDRYRYVTPEEKEEFRQLLRDIDAQLPFDEDSGFAPPEPKEGDPPVDFGLADKLHVATFGLLRQLGIIIVKAADLALRDGFGRIYEHHLHAAVELKRGVLESHLLSEDTEGEDKRVVENPFKAPDLPEKKTETRRRGYRVR